MMLIAARVRFVFGWARRAGESQTVACGGTACNRLGTDEAGGA